MNSLKIGLISGLTCVIVVMVAIVVKVKSKAAIVTIE